MEDFFNRLGLERRLLYSNEEIDAPYRELAKTSHPDVEGGGDEFERVNLARATLLKPSTRLRHLLELMGGEVSTAPPTDSAFMDLFGSIGSLLMRIDGFLEKRKLATTAIGKAVLAGEEMELQGELEKVGADLAARIDAVGDRFGEVDAFIREGDDSRAIGLMAELAPRLVFLEKWQGQVREWFALLAMP